MLGPPATCPRQPISGQQLGLRIGPLGWAGLPPANQQGVEAGHRRGCLGPGSSSSRLRAQAGCETWGCVLLSRPKSSSTARFRSSRAVWPGHPDAAGVSAL